MLFVKHFFKSLVFQFLELCRVIQPASFNPVDGPENRPSNTITGLTVLNSSEQRLPISGCRPRSYIDYPFHFPIKLHRAMINIRDHALLDCTGLWNEASLKTCLSESLFL